MTLYRYPLKYINKEEKTIRVKRWISTLLALALILGCVGLMPVQAASDEVTNMDLLPSQTVDSDEAISAEYTLEEELAQLCEDSGIFRYIDKDNFLQLEHVARLTEEETLNTYVFQNQDGTKSVYYMGENVKYVAPDGSIRDKDITLVSVADGYTMRDNEVQLVLPAQAAEGIAVSYNGNSVRLIPQGGDGAAVLVDNSIIYENYYGRRTALRYTPTLSGVKEEIILAAYTGMSSFSFLLQTGGLGVHENDGQYYLAENEDAEAAFYLGQIIVYDAVGCSSMGSMVVETLVSGQTYRLTVSADVDFLTAPATVYPVVIDPTITIRETMAGGVIEDAPVFSGYPNTNFGNYVFNTIGYTDANYGIGRTVVRLGGLLENETFAALDAENIDMVQFYMKDSGSSSSVVNIHAIKQNSSWTESTVTWNNAGIYSLTPSASATMGGGAWTAFDITNLAKQWKAGTQNGQCGFIMIGAEEDTKKIGTLSCEYGTGDYWPYVVVNYSIDLPLNYYAKAIQKGSGFTLIAYGEDGGALDDVTWTSNNPSVATVSAAGVVTGIRAGTAQITAENADGSSFPCTVYVTMQSGVYRICNKLSGKYLSVEDPDMSTLSNVVQRSAATSGIEYLAQLWWIDYMGNGYYCLRPMNILNQALDLFADRRVCVNTVYLPLENTASDMRWVIEYSVNGYVIRNGDYPNQAISPQASSTAEGVAITSNQLTSLTNGYRWELAFVDGLFLHDSSDYSRILSGSTVYMEYDTTGVVVQPLVSGAGTDLRYSSSDTSVATIDSSGNIAATKRGTTTITVSVTIDDQRYQEQFTLFVQETISVINLIDSTITDDIYALIDDAVAFLNDVYQERFFLHFILDGAPYLYPLAAVDECPHGSEEDCDNTCSRDCSQHHKNVNRIADELYQRFWERNHIVVVWSNCQNRLFCYEADNGIHSLSSAVALVTPYNSSPGYKDFQPIIQLLRIDGNTPEEQRVFMSSVLAHEVAHTLGLQEIYTNFYGDVEESHGGNSEINCFMRGWASKNWEIFQEDILLCPYCAEKLEGEIADRDLYED